MSDADAAAQRIARGLEIKDFTVLAPVLGTSLAVAWEVGRFTPTGGFELFSLSDHLVAAMAAVSVALAAVTFFFMCFGLVVAIVNKLIALKMHPALVAVLLTVVFVAILIWSRGVVWQAPNGSDRVVLAAFALFVANKIWFRFSLLGPVGIGFFFTVAILLCLALSSELMKTELSQADEGKGVATVTTKSSTYKARVLMAGERGLLTYIPEDKKVFFQRADELVRLEVKP